MTVESPTNTASSEFMTLDWSLVASRSEQGLERWFVIRTRSRQEKALASDLLARGLTCVLPVVHEVRYQGKRKAKVVAPLFAGYLFLFGSRDEAFVADRSEHAAQLIDVHDQVSLHQDLRSLCHVLLRRGLLTPCDPLKRGVRVEITSGPFKGVFGTVDRTTGDNRFVIYVDVIGKAAAMEIDRDLLRAV
jgi:hypothetical protein